MAVHPYSRIWTGKTAAPTVNDDASLGYEVGDIWVDETADKTYQATDVADGVARWIGGGSDMFRFGFIITYDGTQETTIAFDGVNTFTLAPTGTVWHYWRNDQRYEITGSKTVTLSATPPATKGHYFIYIDSVDGTLTASTSEWTLSDTKVPVATIAWDNTLAPKYWISDERHSCSIDRRFHWEHHLTDGTEIYVNTIVSGQFVAPAAPVDTNNTYALSEAKIIDEDILHVLAALADGDGTTAQYSVFFRNGAGVWNWEASAVPFRYTAAGYIQYDLAGTMTQGAGNKFYTTYLLLTNLKDAARFVNIHGQTEYTTLAAAQAETFSSLTRTGINIDEFVAVYQFVWETSAAYSTKGKCRLAATPRSITVSASGSVIAGTIDHEGLSGLQGGSTGEHYHLSSADNAEAISFLNGGTGTHTAMDTHIAAVGGSLAHGMREVLTAARTYYVRTDGNDANTGLVDSAGGAFLTIQKAVDVISMLDIAGYVVTVQVKDGTYTGAVALKNVAGFSAVGNLVIQGNSGTPTNVVISTTSNNAFTATSLSSSWDIKNMRIQTTTSGSCILASNSLIRHGGCDFGACAGQHLYSTAGGNIQSIANYTVSGGAAGHHMGVVSSKLYLSHLVTVTANITFTNWGYASGLAYIGHSGASYSLGAFTVTGKKYISELNSVIYSGVTMPGGTAGTTATGGVYV